MLWKNFTYKNFSYRLLTNPGLCQNCRGGRAAQGPDLGGIRAPPGPGPSKDCGALKPSPAQKKNRKKNGTHELIGANRS